MTVQVTCPNPACGTSVSVEEQSLGRRGRCRKCGEVFALARSGGGHDPTASGDASAWKGSAPSRPPAGPAEMPEQFGRYRIIEELGRGGMGAVYLAHDTKLDRRVALKVPFFHPADGPRAVQRFEREARAAATLDHPNLCPIYDVGEVNGAPYLTMPFIEGKPFSEAIPPGHAVGGPQAAAVARKLALALAEAHARGIIHRDLKPGNIMVNRRRELVIMDFGLARMAGGDDDAPLTRTGNVLGTALYMAPEQAAGDVAAIGPASDIYSLGVILYELLTGHRPFEGPWSLVIGLKSVMDPEPPSKHRPGLDPALDAICLKAIAKKPADRHQSMTEFAEALAGYLAAPATAPAPGQSATAPKPASPAEKPESLAAQAFAGLISREETSLRGEKPAALPKPGAAPPRPPARATILAAGGAAALLLGLVVIFVATDKGKIRIELDDPRAVVKVDGQEARIEGLGEPITLRAGEHELSVRWGNGEFQTRKFVVRRGDNEILHVGMEPKMAAGPAAGPLPGQPVTATVPPPSPASAPDHLLAGTVWSGYRSYREGTYAGVTVSYFLHIRERDGTAFKGHVFDNGENRNRSEVEGEVVGESITWREITGAKLTIRGKLAGDAIRLTFVGDYGRGVSGRGDGELTRDGIAGDRGGNEALSVGVEPRGRAQAPTIPADARTIGGKRYKAFKEDLTWHQSRARCEAMGGHLAIVTSEAENRSLMKLISAAGLETAWLGATDEKVEGRWVWVDGTEMKYNSWVKIQPNNRSFEGLPEHYLMILLSQDGGWWDQPDRADKVFHPGFICQWDAGAGRAGVASASGATGAGAAADLMNLGSDLLKGGPEDGWVSLFNGRDLTGWKLQPGGYAHWKVEGGVLVGRGPGMTQIFTDRGDYTNFHARIEACATDTGEAGFVFRSAYFDEGFVKGRGYITQICCNPNNNALMGGMAGNLIAPGYRSRVRAGEWFTMDVYAIGNHITIKINGETSLDYVDRSRAHSRGHLALRQVEGSEIRFRKVEVKELNPSSLEGQGATSLPEPVPTIRGDVRPSALEGKGATSPPPSRIFERRTYIAYGSRLPALNKRFREHVVALFAKHGIQFIASWTPAEDQDGKYDRLIYMLAFRSLEAREEAWKAFADDSEWHKVRDESEKDGKLVRLVESVLLSPTEYSALR